jgi:hypothetical protein
MPPSLVHPEWGACGLRRLDLSANYNHSLRHACPLPAVNSAASSVLPLLLLCVQAMEAVHAPASGTCAFSTTVV